MAEKQNTEKFISNEYVCTSPAFNDLSNLCQSEINVYALDTRCKHRYWDFLGWKIMQFTPFSVVCLRRKNRILMINGRAVLMVTILLVRYNSSRKYLNTYKYFLEIYYTFHIKYFEISSIIRHDCYDYIGDTLNESENVHGSYKIFTLNICNNLDIRLYSLLYNKP